jgi:hypothetical protein
MALKHITRLYRDEFLSEPKQPIWSSVLKIDRDRFLVLGQAEIYSETEGALFLELSKIGKARGEPFRGKLDARRNRKKETDPHLFGFIRLLDSIYAVAAWMCQDDQDDKYFQMTFLETKKPPTLEATLSKSSM